MLTRKGGALRTCTPCLGFTRHHSLSKRFRRACSVKAPLMISDKSTRSRICTCTGPVLNRLPLLSWAIRAKGDRACSRKDLHLHLLGFKPSASALGPRERHDSSTRWESHPRPLAYKASAPTASELRVSTSTKNTHDRICTCNLPLLKRTPLLLGYVGGFNKEVPPVGVAPTWSPLREECIADLCHGGENTTRSRKDSNLQPDASKAPALPIELRERK